MKTRIFSRLFIVSLFLFTQYDTIHAMYNPPFEREEFFFDFNDDIALTMQNTEEDEIYLYNSQYNTTNKKPVDFDLNEMEQLPFFHTDFNEIEQPAFLRADFKELEQAPKINQELNKETNIKKRTRSDGTLNDTKQPLKKIAITINEKPYQCLQCNKSFTQKGNLIRHVRIHTGAKPYKCAFCPQTFAQDSALAYHMRRTHTGEKPYQCSHCNERFIISSHLKQHMGIHTVKKLYPCSQCDKCFTEKSSLTRHIKTTHT